MPPTQSDAMNLTSSNSTSTFPAHHNSSSPTIPSAAVIAQKQADAAALSAPSSPSTSETNDSSSNSQLSYVMNRNQSFTLDDVLPLEPTKDSTNIFIRPNRFVDLYLKNESLKWQSHRPTNRGVMEGWVRFADGRPLDWNSLVFFVDAFPLSGFEIENVQFESSSTYELTIFVRQHPKNGWIRNRSFTRLVSANPNISSTTTNTSNSSNSNAPSSYGVFDVDAELYDCEGNLIAQAKQMGICTKMKNPPTNIRPLSKL